MRSLITKRNITILNLVLLVVFVVTLIAVAVPFVKKEPPVIPFSSDDKKPAPKMAPPPKEVEEYVCPHHPEQKSTSPGKCPECGSDLEKHDNYEVIVGADLFDAHLIQVKTPAPPPPPPLNWELVGVTTIGGRLIAVIRDKNRRTKGGAFEQYRVGVGDEVPEHFGVTITSITDDPLAPSIKYYRPGVGEEELRMGEEKEVASAAAGQDQWSDVIKQVRAGHTYVVKLEELGQQVGSAEAYRSTFGLEPNLEGTRINGLKIASLPRDNLLFAAGLMPGDIIRTINGAAITDEAQGLDLLRRAAATGFNIQIGITRGQTSRTIFYTLLKKK